MNWGKLRYLLPSNRRREEREMLEELDSLRAVAEPNQLGNLTRAAAPAQAARTPQRVPGRTWRPGRGR